MTQATAAVLEEQGGRFELQEIEVDDPRQGEVLIRIVAAGLCHSDLSARDGVTPFPLPGVLGHEGAGVIEAVGEGVNDLAIGDHVVISFTFCGGCSPCRTGHPVYCDEWVPRNLLGGARPDGSPTLSRKAGELHGHFFGQSSFATHVVAAANGVVKVREDAPLELLGPLACGVQTGVQSILNILKPETGHVVAVFGAGSVGLSAIIAAAKLSAARVIAIDVIEERLAVAQKLGAAEVVDARQADPVAAISELTNGRGVDRSLETSGLTSVLRQAIDVLAPLGVCGIVGVPPPDADVPVNVLSSIAKGINIVGVNQGDSVPRESIPALTDLYMQGRLPYDEFVSFYELADIEQAAADAASGKVVKPVIRMPVG